MYASSGYPEFLPGWIGRVNLPVVYLSNFSEDELATFEQCLHPDTLPSVRSIVGTNPQSLAAVRALAGSHTIEDALDALRTQYRKKVASLLHYLPLSEQDAFTHVRAMFSLFTARCPPIEHATYQLLNTSLMLHQAPKPNSPVAFINPLAAEGVWWVFSDLIAGGRGAHALLGGIQELARSHPALVYVTLCLIFLFWLRVSLCATPLSPGTLWKR